MTAIVGSVTFVALFGGETLLATYAAALIALIAALDVAVGFSERARHHNYLYGRWSDLLVQILRHGPPEEQLLRDWLAERALIEKEEPTPISVLDIICHNKEAEAQGYGEDVTRHVRWYQWLFCHLLTIPPNYFPTREERKASDRKSAD